MTKQTSKQPAPRGAELSAGAPFRPRLGDLASDLAENGRIGVVVRVPGASSASYHLRPPGGGREWSAPSSGDTLRHVPVPVTHVSPLKRDVIYDHRAQQAALPVMVHHEDGGMSESVLILTPGQVELYRFQLDHIIKKRHQAGEGER
ncbi:hypothetical protein [Streptomyces rapamycinicus]|uniref:Uncharacterized protein n=2 Tax=Streptomyces rapamycinicus TaxID=1226757 RepID=A0A3L8RJV8_STRRN|nr:hypothetical protein [Streptomyces rapamycinicus]MBB4784420.1 hypothetical protein [Streptomyces rapamycinicus]RLV80096.1 hypothetical protein D3C57_116965 [Streptomyces rapamycinicus NRRL 5491]UTO64732.1 hypothetical protein LJB45_21980 [Streptomyces rapamycinicus]UTP32689.1 hypothetical protein LIV37_27105 [Streptomyces rapamycinicus NRRL 5491]